MSGLNMLELDGEAQASVFTLSKFCLKFHHVMTELCD